MNSFNTENVLFSITILTVIFTVYLYFRKPQINSEIKESEFTLRLNTLREEMINLRDNHIHSLQMRIDDTNKSMNEIALQVGKLATIIDERIPKIK